MSAPSCRVAWPVDNSADITYPQPILLYLYRFCQSRV
nr:MAG TPA: hypothetical protein [Caudoviricetes sp.]